LQETQKKVTANAPHPSVLLTVTHQLLIYV